jgi:1-acyl-sn-glycerol-3-phosphate acyltransferase
VLLFPEGTRSTDGEIKSFKHGAFTLATELGLPVVPIVVDGTRDALPKHGLRLDHPWGLAVRVQVMAAMAPEAGESAEALMARVRARMVEKLAALRADAPNV